MDRVRYVISENISHFKMSFRYNTMRLLCLLYQDALWGIIVFTWKIFSSLANHDVQSYHPYCWIKLNRPPRSCNWLLMHERPLWSKASYRIKSLQYRIYIPWNMETIAFYLGYGIVCSRFIWLPSLPTAKPLIYGTWSGNKIVDHSGVVEASVCRRCSNYIFIVDLRPGFNRLGKGNFKTRW